MPSVNFVLPHWLYWCALVAFPLIAMVLSRNIKSEPGSRTLGIAYFIWLVGGFLGLHRLYLKNIWGFLYWPLFAIILYSGTQEREARIHYSNSVAAVQAIGSSLGRMESRINKSEAALQKARAGLAELPSDDERGRNRFNRTIEKEIKRKADAETKIVELNVEQTEVEPRIEITRATRDAWSSRAFYAFLAIVVFLALDFILIPGMTRKARVYLAAHPDDPVEREILSDDRRFAGTGLVGLIDRISLFSGEFVAFWSVIAVFVYYYEVIVRYVFNSPTNWAHESMFLMFGMQYLIAGAYAALTENHVRVDIFYARMSRRGKAIVDLLTSAFFFIFAGTIMVTGWIFASDAIRQGEVSFTEWAIQYWPVKCVIVVGGALLILQGISKVAKDITLVISPGTDLQNEARNGA